MKQKGVTLIELLAATAVSGLVILLASRLYLAGYAQSLLRSRESELLKESLMLGWDLERRLREDSTRLDAESLRGRYPHLDSMSLTRLKADEEGVFVPTMEGENWDLLTWKISFSWGEVKQTGSGSITR